MKNSNPLERDIEKKVVAYAKSLGMLVYKFTSPSQRSVPDRMFLKNNFVFFAEFKRKGKKPTSAQEIEFQKIRDQGFVVFVIDNAEVGKSWIARTNQEIEEREAREVQVMKELIDIF